MNFATYNILSTSLARPDYYIHNEKKFLKSKYRKEQHRIKLLPLINSEAIIALQEVSIESYADLVILFTNSNYTLLHNSYGAPRHGYMGVALAIPNKYVMCQVQITHPSDNLRKLSQKISVKEKSFFKRLFSCLPVKKPNDYWDDAMNKYNSLILVKLTDPKSNQQFIVATYHMPCSFTIRDIMYIHSIMAMQIVQKFAGNLPYVFMGDFNIKPTDDQYKLLTQGGQPVNTVQPSTKFTFNWDVSIRSPSRSAYATFHGKEPICTNHTKIINSPEPFKDTLDYIFISDQWKIDDVPLISDVDDLLPNKTEPSDHLLVQATLSISS
jgi:mRNA deadenylase 3'-5' endonuclease subunit Ccr4